MFDKVLNMSLGSTDTQDSFVTSPLETSSEPYETSKLERFANIILTLQCPKNFGQLLRVELGFDFKFGS